MIEKCLFQIWAQLVLLRAVFTIVYNNMGNLLEYPVHRNKAALMLALPTSGRQQVKWGMMKAWTNFFRIAMLGDLPKRATIFVMLLIFSALESVVSII